MEDELPTQLILWLYHHPSGNHAIFNVEPTPQQHTTAMTHGFTGPYHGTLVPQDYNHKLH